MSPEGTAKEEGVAGKRRHGRRVAVVLAVILVSIVVGGVIAKRIGERWIIDRLTKLARTRLQMELTIEKVSIGRGSSVMLRGIKLTTSAGREAASCSRLRMKCRCGLGPPVITRVRIEDAQIDVDAFRDLIGESDSWVRAFRHAHFEADVTGCLQVVPRHERGLIARTVKGRIDCEARVVPQDVPADYPAILEVMEALESIGLAPSRVDLQLRRDEGPWLGKGVARCESIEIPLSVQADVPGDFRVSAHLPVPGMNALAADYGEVAKLAQLLEVEGVIAEDLSAESSVSVVPSVDWSELFAPFAEEE